MVLHPLCFSSAAASPYAILFNVYCINCTLLPVKIALWVDKSWSKSDCKVRPSVLSREHCCWQLKWRSHESFFSRFLIWSTIKGQHSYDTEHCSLKAGINSIREQCSWELESPLLNLIGNITCKLENSPAHTRACCNSHPWSHNARGTWQNQIGKLHCVSYTECWCSTANLTSKGSTPESEAGAPNKADIIARTSSVT